MARGGRREGAGRKKGVSPKTPSKRYLLDHTTARTRKILTEYSPLDVMVKTMNAFIQAADILGSDVLTVNERLVTQLGLLERASAIAKDAAPYQHNRLSAVEHSTKDGKPMEHKVLVEFIGANPEEDDEK